MRFVRTNADIGYIRLRVDMTDQSEPSFARGWSIFLRGQPAIFNACHHRERHWYAHHLLDRGEFDRSIAEMKEAQRLDPLSLVINQNLAWILYYAGRYDEAILQNRKTLEIDPNFYAGHWGLGIVYVQQRRYNEAIAAFERSRQLSQNSALQRAWLAYAYAAAGRRAESEKLLAEVLELSKRSYFPPYFIAMVYVGLDQKDRAFDWLEKAFVERSGAIARLKVDPVLGPLRGDSRFVELIRRAEL
jgi:tetratricopeptide (TPR) repeat protein